MSRRTVSFAFAVLLLSTLMIATAAAQTDQEDLVITVWWNGSYEATTDQTVVLRAGWGACTPGFVRPFIKASNFELTLDGEVLLTPEQVDDLWSKPEPAEGLEAYCGYIQNPHSAEWRYELDTSGLEPGVTYLIRTTVTLDRPVYDGGDYDGDGKPDKFPAGLYAETENTLTILDQ